MNVVNNNQQKNTMENKLNDLINWDFIPKTHGRGSVDYEFDFSVYFNPNKKSQTYTMQVHANCPLRIRNADRISFGKLNNNLVVTDENKSNSYKVHKYEASKSAQINGKSLCLSIVKHFGLDKKEKQIIRLKLSAIGNESLRLWQINLYSVERK